MTNTLKKLSCLLVLALSTFALKAQSADLEFGFDGADLPVWNLSGPYELTLWATTANGVVLPMTYAVSIEHDAKGTLRGSGTTTLSIEGEEDIAINYTIKGKVSGGGFDTRATFTVSITGTGMVGGADRQVKLKATYKLVVNQNQLTLVGSAKGSLSIKGYSNSKINEPAIEELLPDNVDGSWYISLDYLPAKKFSGKADIVVSGYPMDPYSDFQGQLLTCDVKGTMSAAATKLQLKGTGGARGSSLKLQILGADTLTYMKGKILGQKVLF